MFFAGAPTIGNKIEFKIQNTKVASPKVAFDTVRLRGRTATQRSKKGSEKVLGRVLEKGVLRRVLSSALSMGFTVEKGSEKGSQKGF